MNNKLIRKSIAKIPFEILMVLIVQLFMLIGFLWKIYNSSINNNYIIIILIIISVIALELYLFNNLYKKICIYSDKIIIKWFFGKRLFIMKNNIKGYWIYKTIGAFGEEESINIRTNDNKKITFSRKAYKNYPLIKREIIRLGLINLRDYNYKETNFKYFKYLIPIFFLLSMIMFILLKLFDLSI
jgi:hypothetical protein